jgi:uncharacterized protein
MSESKKTLVIGASDNPERYSNLAIHRLHKHGHEVVALGRKEVVVDGVQVAKENMAFDNVDTVTLYVNPTHQEAYYDYILSLQPKRIIFNPGTENPAFEQMAEAKGIATIEACTLVMLATGQY